MKKRKLGKSNLEVSALGLGCMSCDVGYVCRMGAAGAPLVRRPSRVGSGQA